MASTSTAAVRPRKIEVAAPRVLTSRAKTPPVAAPQSVEQEYHFDVPAEFPIFGRWREPTASIAAEEHADTLARWMTANESPEIDDDALWQRCVEQHPNAFNALRAMDLFDSSLDLPRGTVVFQSIIAPPWIKDDPPGEILDRLAAVYQRYPEAEVWLHEPVYGKPVGDEPPELLTSETLNEEASRARDVIWDEYRKSRRKMRADLRFRRAAAWLRDAWWLFHRRRAVQRKAIEFRNAYYDPHHEFEVAACIEEARELGLETEADFLHWTAYGPDQMTAEAIDRAQTYYHSATFWTDIKDAVTVLYPGEIAAMTSLAVVAIPLAMLVVPLLPTFIVIDPILTFTLPEDRGRHWFIGHWDWKPSPDGEKKLVYI